ncbi:MAG: hypothetical protein VX130_05170 [Verrucomicrobiota bacterium]|nr:hypothetical protein [Verrucomicrobiota bacterium]
MKLNKAFIYLFVFKVLFLSSASLALANAPSGYYFWSSNNESFVGMAINSNGQGHVLAYNDNGSGSMLYDSFNLSESGDFSVSTWDEYSGTTALSGTVTGNLFSGIFAGMSFQGYRRDDSGRASEFAGFYSGTSSTNSTLKKSVVFISPDGQAGEVVFDENGYTYDGEIVAIYKDGNVAHLDMTDGEKMTGAVSLSGSTLTGTGKYSLLDGQEEEQWSHNSTRDFYLNTSNSSDLPEIRISLESDDLEAFNTISLFEQLSALLNDEITGLSFLISDDGKNSGNASFSANTKVQGLEVNIS